MIAGSSLFFLIHMKYVVFCMFRTIKMLVSNWPRKLKFSQFLQAGKTCQLLLTFLTKVTRWSRCTSNFYALIAFPTECTKWNSAAIKSLLLFMASLFIGFLVEKYVASQSRKSDFGWHRFRFPPYLMRKRVEQSEAILALLDSFQCISNGKPEKLLYLTFVFYI